MKSRARTLVAGAVAVLCATIPAAANASSVVEEAVRLIYETGGPIVDPSSPVDLGDVTAEAMIVITKELGKAPVVSTLPSQDPWAVPVGWDCAVDPAASTIDVACAPKAPPPFPGKRWICASPWVVIDHSVGLPGDTSVSGSTACGGQGFQSCAPLTVPGVCDDSDGLPAPLPSFTCSAVFDGSLAARASHAWVVSCYTTDP